MKKILSLLALVICLQAQAQTNSTLMYGRLFPARVGSADRANMAINPSVYGTAGSLNGVMVYDTNLNAIFTYTNGAWLSLAAGLNTNITVITPGTGYAAISNAFQAGGTVYFVHSDYPNIGNLVPANNLQVYGNGAKLHMILSATNFLVDESTNVSGVLLDGLDFEGDANADFVNGNILSINLNLQGVQPFDQTLLTNRGGLRMNCSGQNITRNCIFAGFGGAGFMLVGTNKMAAYQYKRSLFYGNTCYSNLYGGIHSAGIFDYPLLYNAPTTLWADGNAEYQIITDCYFYANGCGLYESCGNHIVTACQFTGNLVNYGMTGTGQNTGHGITSHCTFNHGIWGIFGSDGGAEDFDGDTFYSVNHIHFDAPQYITMENAHFSGVTEFVVTNSGNGQNTNGYVNLIGYTASSFVNPANSVTFLQGFVPGTQGTFIHTGGHALNDTTNDYTSLSIIQDQSNLVFASISNFDTFIGNSSYNASNAYNQAASQNTGVGYSIMEHLTNGVANAAVGLSALQTLYNGNQNTALGKGALQFGQDINGMIGIGPNAGANVLHGLYGIYLYHGGAASTENGQIYLGSNQFTDTHLFGQVHLNSLTNDGTGAGITNGLLYGNGANLTGIFANGGPSLYVSNFDTIVGLLSYSPTNLFNAAVSQNTGFGWNIMEHLTNGVANTGVGLGALQTLYGGNQDTALGKGALQFGQDISGFVGIGPNAGANVLHGLYGIYLYHGGAAATENGQIYIGSNQFTDTHLFGQVHLNSLTNDGTGAGITNGLIYGNSAILTSIKYGANNSPSLNPTNSAMFPCVGGWGLTNGSTQRWHLEYTTTGTPTASLQVTFVGYHTNFAGSIVTSNRFDTPVGLLPQANSWATTLYPGDIFIIHTNVNGGATTGEALSMSAITPE